MGLRFDVEVSLALGADLTADPSTWSWTDITAYAMLTDGGVEIRRGRADRQTQTQPSTCTVRLNNADGRFSRLNPAGAYYGQLRKNTPLRVRACEAGGTLVTRFVGYVSEWPPRWTHGQKHQWVPVRADGVLRRLGQGSVARSAMHRSIVGANSPNVVAYWPMDDGAETSVFGSGLAGKPPAAVTAADFASDASLVGAGAVATFTATTAISASVSGTFPGDQWQVLRVMKMSAPPGSRVTLLDVDVSGGDAVRWLLEADATDVYLTAFDAAGGTVHSVSGAAAADWFDGNWKFLTMSAISFGTTVFQAQAIDVTSGLLDNGVSGSGVTAAGSVTRLSVPASADLEGLATGHWTVLNLFAAAITLVYNDSARGYPGEAASDRIERLCDEEDLPVDVTAGDSALMGPQKPGTLLGLLRECEAADHGVLYEALTGELAYQPLSALYNLTAALALDHDQGHIVDIEVADDDRLTRNDITVTRTDGPSARAVDETSIAAVGHYDTAATLNLYTDDQPEQHAAWLLHVGTSATDEYRYPRVDLALHKSTSLVTSWLAADVGSRMTIDNLPANPSPDQADLIIEGYTERVNSVAYEVSINLAPYAPYDLGEYQDTDASGDVPRYDTEWSSVAYGLLVDGSSGNYASTPDDATLDITGDIDLRWDGILPDWTPSSFAYLLSKYSQTSNQRSYALRLETDGKVSLFWSTDGSAASNATSTVAPTVRDGERLAIRATLDVDNGSSQHVVTFYTSDSIDGGWTQLGSAVTTAGTTSIFSSTAVLAVSGITDGTVAPFAGLCHAAQVLDGIDGTVVANPRFDDQTTADTSFDDSSGLTWTINGTAEIFGEFTTGTSTALLVATSVPPLWTVDPPGGWPILIKVSGAVLSVTGIAGSTPVQEFTVSTTVANGVTKAIPGGSEVRVFRPAQYGL